MPVDYTLAANWYRKAAEAGYLAAQNELGLLFAEGHGVPVNYIEAFAWVSLPAAAGDEEAVRNRDHLLELMDKGAKTKAQRLAAKYKAAYGQRQ